MLRKGHRDLPFFFDELNDALEAHDAEEYSPAPCGRCSPVTIMREAELYQLAQARCGN